MNEYKLTFENNRTCTIECEQSGKPLQDKINEAENRYNSPVAKINDKSVKKHNLGGFILGAVIGGMLGKSVPAHTVSKTAKSVKSNTKKVVRSVKKQVKKFDVGGITDKDFDYYVYPTKRVQIAFFGKIQQGSFFSLSEAMTEIENRTKGYPANQLEKYAIVTPDKTFHLGKKQFPIRYDAGGPVGSSEEVKKHFSQFIVPEYVQGSSKYLYKMLDPNGNEVKEYFVFAKSNLLPEFEKFKAQFEDKGYFLTKNNEKIPLDELYKYIRIIPYKQEAHEFETYYADGGMVGKQIVFERYGEERIGKITEDLGDGRLSVVSGSGSHAITPENIVSFIDTPEKKKGWFSFKDGGKLVYHNGREYPTGSAWTKEHNYRNKSQKHERYDAGGPVIPMYMDEDGFVFNGSSYIHEPSGYTLELEFSEGDETDNGTLVEENLYVIYDNDGQMVSSDAEPLEVAKETLLDYISNEFGKGGPVGRTQYHIELGKKEILRDVQSGLVPDTVKSFRELHNYVDANEYAGFTNPDYQISHNYVFENIVQKELDNWIRSGGLKNVNSQNKFNLGGPVGKYKVGVFDENQLKNKEDKKAIEKAQRETGLKYIENKIIKKGNKMFMEVYLSNKYGKGGPVGNSIEKRIKNLTKKGYIVKQTRKEPDGSWYYKIQTPENASNDAGMGIGYVANSHYYHHTHGADDNKTGNIWFHKNTNNRGRGSEYSFSENEINSLLDQKENQKFDVGGPVGQMNNAKSYWNRFDKKRKIDFLISAGFSKSVANDLSNENWDTLEPTVHKKLLAVLMVNGGPVETSEQKYRLLSPDGFDIEMDAVYTESELMPAFEKFKKRFENQGYYSTSNRTKIDLRDLEDYMQVVEYNEIEDYN